MIALQLELAESHAVQLLAASLIEQNPLAKHVELLAVLKPSWEIQQSAQQEVFCLLVVGLQIFLLLIELSADVISQLLRHGRLKHQRKAIVCLFYLLAQV
jgi:hypothetical protein